MTDPAPQLIDWKLATSLGSRLAGAGPEISRVDADAAVAELREAAGRSTPLVAEFTGLKAGSNTAPLLVVDRAGWVRANAESFEVLLQPFVEKSIGRKPQPPLARAIGSRVAGTELGLLLGFMGSKVLGQFDPFTEAPGAEGGRLMLVAPNIVHVERELDADPSDFRLWVALHEETHRVQFTAVPWMRAHLRSEIQSLAETMDPDRMLSDTVKRISESLRSREGASLVEMLSTPEQREVIDRVTGVMSLLEGHADVVMDGVGPSVIPSVAEIRIKFTSRRKGVGGLDRILRRLLGLEAKMAQYRDGASFVRSVVDKAGMEEFNAVWAEPANLPSKAEIHDPAAWMTRVLG